MTDDERVIVPVNFSQADPRADRPVRILVGQAELKLSQDPQVVLYTAPLGAGLGIAIYDAEAKVGGLMNCLLPDSDLDEKRAVLHPAMFMNTGWAALMTCAQQLKAVPERIRVFAAGAAEIMDDISLLNVGKKNQKCLREFLRQKGFTLNAENLGGRTNCSIELSMATGEVRLRFSGQIISKFLCKP
jgi:chemotaxis protein CheD